MLLNTKNSSPIVATKPDLSLATEYVRTNFCPRYLFSYIPVEPSNFGISVVVSNLSETNQEAINLLKETQMDRRYNHLLVIAIENN